MTINHTLAIMNNSTYACRIAILLCIKCISITSYAKWYSLSYIAINITYYTEQKIMNDLTPIALMVLKYCEMIVTSIDITHAVWCH